MYRRAKVPVALRTSDSAVIHAGDCTEHDRLPGERPARGWQGWNTVALVPGDRGRRQARLVRFVARKP